MMLHLFLSLDFGTESGVHVQNGDMVKQKNKKVYVIKQT
jgi:hypothetical protein